MNFLRHKKDNSGDEPPPYDVMSDPGPEVKHHSTTARRMIPSGTGYQYAVNHFNATQDPQESSSQRNASLGTANPLVRNIQGTSVPASRLTTNSTEPTGNYRNTINHGNHHVASGENTLSYSQSIDSSSSPEKRQQSPSNLYPSQQNQFHNQNQNHNARHDLNHYTRSPNLNSQKQPQRQREQKIEGSSSSTFDDYLESSSNEMSPPNSPSSSYSFPNYPGSPAHSLKHRRMDPNHGTEPEMVDSTYAEHYGDAYTGKPIRYIYPKGYGSMRPRSRPWQIALILCGVFAWLNVFIVGHCADRFENDGDDGYYNANQQANDDGQNIDAKWCGSQTLYFVWVLSVALTGLSCAYCSIIGYVKARDFAIANGRSQPPGMVGKTDYYVQIEEDVGQNKRRFSGRDLGGKAGIGYSSYQDDRDASNGPKKTIYQADGTPRFFGGHIYKPTQAAVSLTSR